MAEYGRYDRLSSVVRFINDILLSAPSIVIGLFIYEVMVAPMGHFSGFAGAVALAVLVMPVVVRTTEDMLTLVPNQLREAAVALALCQERLCLLFVFDQENSHWRKRVSHPDQAPGPTSYRERR